MAILCIVFEAGILFSVRKYLPGGVAPASIVSSTDRAVTGMPQNGGPVFDKATLGEIHAWVSDDLGAVDTRSPVEAAKILRDWARTQVSEIGPGIETHDPISILYSMKAGEPANCRPLADLYYAVLSAYGIPARIVSLFGYPGGFDQTHATVEIWTGNKWIIEDPTFDSIAEDQSGNLLSAAEIQERYLGKADINWVQDASKIQPDFNTNGTSPEILFKVIIYEIRSYPVSASRFSQALMKMRDRLTGKTQSAILFSDKFPIPKIVLNGVADKILLAIFLVSIIVIISPIGKPRLSPKNR